MQFNKKKFQKNMSNGFQKSRLSNKGPKSRILTPPVLAFLTAFLIVGVFVFGVFQAVKGINFRSIISVLGTDLKEDKYGHTNILLLGTGTANHDGTDLTDTMMIASVDQETQKVNFLSIPRDLWIEDKKYGGMRINNVYFAIKKEFNDSALALDVLEQHIENVIGIDVQYRIKVDFDVFKEVVDAVGGIDLYVPETINDPLYPKGETSLYETFYIAQGQQHLDGETALKYARSRHTTSDFSRSQRQQSLIFAIKEKVSREGKISDIGMLEDIYNAVKTKVEMNIGVRELITLAEMGAKIDRTKMGNYMIHDDPSKCGGFLYTPEKSLYGGAFVFVPAGNNFDGIRKMANIVLYNSQVKDVKIQVLNGTKKLFLAGSTKVILQRNCMTVTRFGNGKDTKQPTTIYYRKKNTPEVNTTLSVLQQFIPGEISDQVPPEYLTFPYESDSDIILNLGNDYLKYEIKDPYDALFTIVKPEKTENNETAPAVTTPSE